MGQRLWNGGIPISTPVAISQSFYILSQNTHWTIDGKITQITNLSPECHKDTDDEHIQDSQGTRPTRGIGATCCDENGQGTRPGRQRLGNGAGQCQDRAHTFIEATLECADVGLRLCTQQEIEGGAGWGTGYMYDNHLVWVSDEYAVMKHGLNTGKHGFVLDIDKNLMKIAVGIV